MLLGHTNNPIFGGFSLWGNIAFFKINPVNGNIYSGWDFAYGDENAQFPTSFKQTTDGGYIIVGDALLDPSGGYFSIFVLKLDKFGAREWDYAYGTEGVNEYAQDVIETSNGYFIIVGFRIASGPQKRDGLALVIEADGDISFAHRYGNDVDFEDLRAIKSTSDDGYIMVGSRSTNQSTDVYVVKTDQALRTGCEQLYPITQINLDYQLGHFGTVSQGGTSTTGGTATDINNETLGAYCPCP